MISSIEAANIAKSQLPLLTSEPATDVRVEEVELSEQEDYWYITLGYSTPDTMTGFGKYKTFKIHAVDGKIVAMKIRRVQ